MQKGGGVDAVGIKAGFSDRGETCPAAAGDQVINPPLPASLVKVDVTVKYRLYPIAFKEGNKVIPDSLIEPIRANIGGG